MNFDFCYSLFMSCLTYKINQTLLICCQPRMQLKNTCSYFTSRKGHILRDNNCTALQSHKAVSAHVASKQILPFAL